MYGRPVHAHAHRNSFSAATYTNHFGNPPQNPYRSSPTVRSSSIESPWPVYALDWCLWHRQNSRSSGRIAIGSFSDDMPNRLQVLNHTDDGELQKVAEVDATLPFPVTKVKWEPPRSDKPDATMIATCGDYLRIFSVGQTDGRLPGKIVQEVLLGNVRNRHSQTHVLIDFVGQTGGSGTAHILRLEQDRHIHHRYGECRHNMHCMGSQYCSSEDAIDRP